MSGKDLPLKVNRLSSEHKGQSKQKDKLQTAQIDSQERNSDAVAGHIMMILHKVMTLSSFF